MATLGFEVCREAHQQNREAWSASPTTNSSRERASAATSNTMTESTGNSTSRLRDFMRRSNANSTGASLSALRRNDGEASTAASHFSDDTGRQSAETTYSERIRRKRRFAARLMISYLCLASTVFLGVLLWKHGLIFNNSDERAYAVQGISGTGGFDESGNMICNGLALNCHRRANEIMYATVHNAMSSKADNFLAFNNMRPLEDALVAGFRGLTLDSCDCARIGIQLCHGVCIAGFRRPIATFAAIVDFLKENEHEVIVVEIEAGDESLGPLFDILLPEVPGLSDLMYQHEDGTKWPKLKDMVEMDKVRQLFSVGLI